MDGPTLNDEAVQQITAELVALQAERIRWLRKREIESGEPLREITVALRILNQYIDRAERLDKRVSLPFGPTMGGGRSADALAGLIAQDYARTVGSHPQEGDSPQDPRPRSAIPSRLPTRAEVRRARRLSKPTAVKAA